MSEVSTMEREELRARLGALHNVLASHARTTSGSFAARRRRLTVGGLAAEREPYEVHATLPGALTGTGLTFYRDAAPNVFLTADQELTQDRLHDSYTYFQLLGLAIDTGYLPPDKLKAAVRKRLQKIFKPRGNAQSESAEFEPFNKISASSFDVERYLQDRAQPQATGSTYFAMFVATDEAILTDPLCRAWENFLWLQSSQHEQFYSLLNNFLPAETRRHQILIAGAQFFLRRLADFFRVLPEPLQNRFGDVYVNRLAKFFGYQQGSASELSLRPWAYRESSWAPALLMWLTENCDADGAGSVQRRMYHESLTTLTPIWERVQRAYDQRAGLISVGAHILRS